MQHARRLGAVVWVLLAAGASVLWVRGRWGEDALMLFAPGGRMQAVAVGEGRVHLWLSNINFGPERAWRVDCTRGSKGDAGALWRTIPRITTRKVTAGPFAGMWELRDSADIAGAWFICIALPCWLVVPLLWIPPALIVRRKWQRWRWRRTGRCLCCGYDLRASPGRCPECGMERSAAAVEKPRRRRLAFIAVPAVAAAVALMFMALRPTRPAPTMMSTDAPDQPLLRMYDISRQARTLAEAAIAHGAADDDALRRQARQAVASALQFSADASWEINAPSRMRACRVEQFGDRVAILSVPAGHWAAARTMEGLLAGRGQVVSVEMRVIRLGTSEPGRPLATMRSWALDGLDVDLPEEDAARRLDKLFAGRKTPIFLDDQEVSEVVRQTQSFERSSIVTAPRMTVLGGTAAYLIVGNQQAYVKDYAPSPGGGMTPVIDVATSGTSAGLWAVPGAEGEPMSVEVDLRLGELLRMDRIPCPPKSATRPTTRPLLIDKPVMNVFRLRSTLAIPPGRTAALRDIRRMGDDATPLEQGEVARDVLVLIKPVIKGPWMPTPAAAPPGTPPPAATPTTTRPAGQ